MKIKAYTSFCESTKTHYYREFEIVNSLPQIGEVDEISPAYDGQKHTVVSIEECYIDCEQGNDEVYNYNYYVIKKTFETLNDSDEWEFVEEIEEFVAIAKE